jgi:signal transduction histidine kinase
MAKPDLANDDALAALNRAAVAVASNLSLDKVLRQIVESARELAGARYAALGIPDGSGGLMRFIHSGMPSEDVARIPHLPEGKGLLGSLLAEGRTIRIPHISDDPRSIGFPPGHPPMDSFLGVPIRIGGEVVGNLYLTDKVGATEFSNRDQKLIELLAANAAIAIKNARLYEQVGRLAIVEERSRIGMDLHDGVIQAIYAVGLTLESVRLLLSEQGHSQDEPIKVIDKAIDSLNDAIRDIRNFILDLRPRRYEGDLDQGLARLAREFQANTMTPVALDVEPQITGGLDTAIARALFFTTQEALANVARHAKADRVSIVVNRNEHDIALFVEDDGVGFDVDSKSQTTGHGLANMRARAEELDGEFAVESQPGAGTRICFRLPTSATKVAEE